MAAAAAAVAASEAHNSVSQTIYILFAIRDYRNNRIHIYMTPS